jgi:hypothetical protein
LISTIKKIKNKLKKVLPFKKNVVSLCNKTKTNMATKQLLKKVYTLGWSHAMQGIFQNPFSEEKQTAQYNTYINGHNQGKLDLEGMSK